MSKHITHIINEEKSFVLCTKPVGISSQAESGKDKESMLDVVSQALGIDVESVFPVHRLDTDTSGVMVYAKTPLAAKKLSALVFEHRMDKRYIAIVHGVPDEPCGVFKDFLFKDSSRGKSFVVDKMRKGVKDASLEYTVLSTIESQQYGRLSLVCIKLHTGRTHQIRVQFSSRNMPLVGDRRYGGNDGCGMALHAYSLEFDNPFVKGKKVSGVFFPDVNELPWSIFADEIHKLTGDLSEPQT